MADEDAIRNALETVFGVGGSRLLSHGAGSMRIEPFYGKDTEDPIRWLNTFKRAATANGWADEARKVAVAGAYLKDLAADWFVTIKPLIRDAFGTGTAGTQGNNASNFEDQFQLRFADETKRNLWYQQLLRLRQQSNESIDSYANKFNQLSTCVGLADDSQKRRMFITGLNPAIAPFVTMSNPTDLAAAITAARMAETGFNMAMPKVNLPPVGEYTSTSTSAQPTSSYLPMDPYQPTISGPAAIKISQQSDIDKLTQQLEKLTINYANLASAFSAQIPASSQPKRSYNNNNTNQDGTYQPRRKADVVCYRCNKKGHYARECTADQSASSPQPPTKKFTRRAANVVEIYEDEKDADYVTEEEYEEEEEAEVYMNTRSGRSVPYNTDRRTAKQREVSRQIQSESNREQNLRTKRIRPME